MYTFLFLSLLSGLLELGSVYLGIAHEFPVYLIIALPFFYQIGNLLMNIISRKILPVIIFVAITIILAVFNIIRFSYYLFAVQLICNSYCIQHARMQYKKICPTWLKRCFRIGGFAFSPALVIYDGQIILIFSALLCLWAIISNAKMYKFGANNTFEKIKHQKPGVSTVMVFHQLHYFVYTYIMPIYVYTLTKSISLSALAFSCTWVIYLLPQIIAEKNETVNYKKLFFSCHLFLAICMLIIGISVYYQKSALALIAWLLTGFGGGSVFCISHLSKKYESINMDFSENIGHFLGPLTAVILCYAFGDMASVILPMVSALFVIIALNISIYIIRKDLQT